MSEKIRNRLERLGLPVNFSGNSYLATSTEYRNGDNPRGVWCYENNVWDAIESRFLTWEKFVSICKKITEADAKKWLAGADVEDGEHEEKEERIELPKKLREEDYQLIRSYDFFLKRGISRETLDAYGAGLCQSGSFYGRVCFPIRMKGILKGITGRDVLKREGASKWKIKGPKNEFIYPLFEPDIFKKTRQVVLVESVGDSLSLWNDSIKQNLVTFGTNLSAKLLGFLLTVNPETIFVSLNNDLEGVNRGQIGAEKIIKKLSSFFSQEKIVNAPPFEGDFGDQGQIIGRNLEWAAQYGVKIN